MPFSFSVISSRHDAAFFSLIAGFFRIFASFISRRHCLAAAFSSTPILLSLAPCLIYCHDAITRLLILPPLSLFRRRWLSFSSLSPLAIDFLIAPFYLAAFTRPPPPLSAIAADFRRHYELIDFRHFRFADSLDIIALRDIAAC
jgi:hypothetical protein